MKTIATLLVALATLASAACIEEAHASPPAAPLAVVDAVAAGTGYNTAGNRAFATARVKDATGVVTTVAAAGTYVTVGTAAPLAAGDVDSSGCITYALATNKFTIAGCGAGTLRLEACLNDVIGTDAKYFLGAWHQVRSSVTTVVSPILRDGTEPTTAARKNRGCIVEYVSAQSGDTYDFRFDAETSGNTITTRNAHFVVEKISSF